MRGRTLDPVAIVLKICFSVSIIFGAPQAADFVLQPPRGFGKGFLKSQFPNLTR
jgi:hypothetical protein